MTEGLLLQHTRGVPLRNVCLLCVDLQLMGGSAGRRELMLAGRTAGLRGFDLVAPDGALPTRVRHHEYALRQLELAVTEGASCSLTTKGEVLAELAQVHRIQASDAQSDGDSGLPAPVKAHLRDTLCSSRYVRYWWLRYFMPVDSFTLIQLVEVAADVVVELVPSRERITQPTANLSEFADTGYRVHSYFHNRKSLRLDEAGRREIHEGLRQWTMRVDLVSEVSGWHRIYEIEEEYLHRLESRNSVLHRAYIVRRHWEPETPIDELEALISRYRARIGGPQRIHIPRLIIDLAIQERLSVRTIRQLLLTLYTERSAGYFFEPASRRLLAQPGNPFPLESYVYIDGAWRAAIVVTE